MASTYPSSQSLRENDAVLSSSARARELFLRTWPDALIWLACTASITIAVQASHEGWWYPLGTIMHHPERANAAFGYRLLFPLIAVFLQKIVPHLTDHNAFVAVQALNAGISISLVGIWSKIFFPRYGRPLGYILASLMIIPTLNYWTFYDIAIVGFWTACFLLLYLDQIPGYLLVFALATLNHENILLIIPCATAYYWGRMPLRRLALFACLQVALWFGVRQIVEHLSPGGALFDWRLWQNLIFWRTYSIRSIVLAGAVLVPWWLVALGGWRDAPRILRTGLLAWPGLFLVTILFGRIEEARQFAAFIPVCIGLISSRLGRDLASKEVGKTSATDAAGDAQKAA